MEELLQDEKCQTVCSLAQQLDIGKTSVHNLLKKDLKMSKIALRFIPKDLTAAQKQGCVWICEQNLQALKDDDTQISKVITGDESWISVLDLKTKQASMEWHPKGTVEGQPEKALRQRGDKKSMFTIFFEENGPVLSEFKDQNDTVHAETDIQLLQRLRERIRHKCPDLLCTKEFLIHHDNASPYMVNNTMDYLRDNNMQLLPHPPNNPDLAPVDYFLFGRLKSSLRGHRFQNVDDMQTAVFRELQAINKQEFHDALNFLPLCWMKCIKAGGSYFEGHHIVVNPSDFGLEGVSGDEYDSETSDSNE